MAVPRLQRANARLHGRTTIAWTWLCAGIVALGVGSSSCAKARAESAPDGPPLQVPAAPPRVLAPLEDPLPATAAVPESTPAAPPRTAARPPVRRPETEPRAEAPAPAAVQPQPEPAPTETRELRATPPGNNAATAERNVRDLLTRAAQNLSRVDYGRLSADGKAQYDQSKRFAQQAEQALKERNYVFATTLADKAAALATELVGR